MVVACKVGVPWAVLGEWRVGTAKGTVGRPRHLTDFSMKDDAIEQLITDQETTAQCCPAMCACALHFTFGGEWPLHQ